MNVIAHLTECYSESFELIEYTRDTVAGSMVDITDMDIPHHKMMAYIFPYVVISLTEKILAENPTRTVADNMIEVSGKISEMCYIDPDDSTWGSTKMGELTQIIEAYVFIEVSNNGWPSGESDYVKLGKVINKVLTEYILIEFIDEIDELDEAADYQSQSGSEDYENDSDSDIDDTSDIDDEPDYTDYQFQPDESDGVSML